jgi:hypothetical protein
MRTLTVCVAALAVTCTTGLALSSPPAATAAPKKSKSTALPRGSKYLLPKINRYRQQTWYWQQVMGQRPTPAGRGAERSRSKAYREWALRTWKQRAATARRQASSPPRLWAWQCIYRHERHPAQGWATRTGNGFYGGLQMDMSFQRTYGGHLLRRKGTANNWTSLEQIWVAERAYRSGRGFHPWPNTARACGLM